MGLRIARLDLTPWGSFAERSLQFSTAPGAVELIDGPNAAGKSTISRAEVALLFGIPQRTVDAHTYEYADLRIGAALLIDGQAVELVRRKAKVGSLLGPDGIALRHDPLPTALGGLSREIYESLFFVDHDTLVRGGEELLQGKGEIGSSLFAAAAGIATLHDRLSAFDEQVADIYRPRARSTAMIRELASLHEAERRFKQSVVRPATYRRMQAELRAAQARSAELAAAIATAETEAARLARQLELAPLFVEHRELAGRRERLGVLPDLVADAGQRRASAQASLRSEGAQRDRGRRERERLADEAAAIAVNVELLAHASEIRAAHEQVPVIVNAAGDQIRLRVQLATARSGLDAVSATVGVTPKKLAQLRRPEAVHRELDQALAERDQLRERHRGAQERVQQATDRRSEILSEGPEVPAVVNLALLEAALQTAHTRLGLAEQLSQAQAQCRRSQTQAAGALGRLRPAPPRSDLLALPVVADEVIAGLQLRAGRLKDAERELAADRRRLAEQETELAGTRERLRQEGEVATLGQLETARRDRDRHWKGLRRDIDAGRVPGSNLAARYEATARTADQAADALAANAAGAALAASVAADTARLAAVEADLQQRQATLDREAAAIATEWSAAWAVTGLELIALEHVAGWKRDREEAEIAIGAAADALAEADVLARQLDGAVAELRDQVAPHVADLPPTVSLAQLVEVGEAVVKRHNAAATRAVEHAEKVAGIEREQRLAGQAATSANEDLQQWLSQWPDRCARAGLPQGTDPDRAHETVRAISEGLACLDQIGELEARINGIDRDRTTLHETVRSLCAELAPDLCGQDPERCAAILHDRVAGQERQRNRHDELTERLRAADDALREAESNCQQAEDELAELCAAAGCDSADELPRIEQDYQAAAALDQELDALRRRVAALGRASFPEVAEQMTDFDHQATEEALARVAERVQTLAQERDSLSESIGQAKARLAEAEHDELAVAAAEDIEFSQARIQELAREYALARLSAAVLRRAIERYRDRHQDPLVRRANHLFGRFTEGTYAELFVDVDEKGNGYLVARRNDRAIHTMTQMSKGTREQLFLALRIAAIERYVEMAGPMPVVFDDVFIESDDARCAQIFAALAELATRTQVIVLTHHHHLVAIAQDVLGPKLHVQDLPSAKAELRAAA